MMRRLPFLFSAYLLSACSLNALPVTQTPAGGGDPPSVTLVAQVPTAAFDALPTATATLLPPTLAPTPSIPPDQALQTGDRYLLNGYYEDAVTTYQTVLLQANAPEAVRADAAFRMGQAALREGLFGDAVNALSIYIAQFPNSPRLPQAHFLRGDAQLGLSQWAAAQDDFRAYLALRPGVLDSYAYERIGDAQLGLGQADAALASYAQAANAERTLPSQLALRERVAQVHLTNGNVDAALAEYDAILAVAQNAPYRATIEFTAAQALINASRLDAGLGRMNRVFSTYPTAPEAYQALLALLANGQSPDALAQARVAFNHGDYNYVVQVVNTYTTTHQLAAVPAEMHLLLGRSYRELGNPAAAVVAFQTILDQYPQDPAFGEALLEQGRTRFLSGDIPGAIEHYLNIADTYGYLPEAAEALWRAGYLYGTNDQPDQSRAAFERLADAYPNTDQARSGLALAASAAYTAGNSAAAEVLYGRLATTSTGDEQASAYFLAGKLALERGETRIADASFAQVVNAAPDSFFSARAQDIAQGRAAFQPPPELRLTFDEAAEIAAAEAWLRQTFGITQEGALWQLAPALGADPRLIRGTELWTVAAFDEADAEFTALLDVFQTDPLASYQLAVYLRTIGAYENAIVAGANVIRAAGVGTTEAPAFIARMRYPIFYADLVVSSANERAVDPLLMFSLIRHESLFNTNATAAAGEKGLTQVIPSTGEYIASLLTWPDYQHADLFRPYAGIAFGVTYLDEQLELFDGNTVAALAAYNAGPGRAAGWLDLSGGDPDLFMSAITIDSTRTYVQRIYSYHAIYRALYGAA